jgi:hypothetical protein
MSSSNNQKNKECEAKHRKTARKQMVYEEYGEQKRSRKSVTTPKRKSKESTTSTKTTTTQIININELFDLPTLKPLDINNLINALPPLPNQIQQKIKEDTNQHHKKILMII